jgi:hypothetical protein
MNLPSGTVNIEPPTYPQSGTVKMAPPLNFYNPNLWGPKMETKSLWQSKTFWGIVISGLAGLLGIWGKEISPADQDAAVSVALTLVGLIGTILGVVGRVTATKKIAGAPPVAPLLLVAVLSLGVASLTGCPAGGVAIQSPQAITSAQTAVDVGYKLSSTYFTLHNSYTSLIAKADAPTTARLKTVVAPALNKAKRAIIVYNDVALLWMQTGEYPTDILKLLADAQALMVDAAALWKEVTK